MTEELYQKITEQLSKDENFQRGKNRYNEVVDKAMTFGESMIEKVIEVLDLANDELTLEQARFNLMVAKMSVAKMLSTLSSFSYEEEEFFSATTKARDFVANELIPHLLDSQPCEQCDECKNGRPDNCINPTVREEYTESRFLPIICEALIDYDIFNEILYHEIPQDLRDEDVLKDLDEEFQEEVNKITKPKKRGRPKKTQETNEQEVK